MSSKAPLIVAGIIVGVALIVAICLLASSFAKVEQTQVGLLYSHASRKIERKDIYSAGRYYVGVGGEFITFPITQQELSLPTFESRTSDGLKISLDVSINYKIDKDYKSIIQIFDHFGRHYEGYLSRLAMNIIRDASARFTAFQYSQNRSLVSQEMEADIYDDMHELGFTLDSVQLLNVAFPSNFSNTLQNTLLLQQQVTQAEMNKDAEKVALDGQFSKSNITASNLVTEAYTQATTITENADAESEALIASLQKEAASHKNMIDFFYNMSYAITSDENASKAEARVNFANWYWMNQISSSKASKNFAVSIPDAFVPSP